MHNQYVIIIFAFITVKEITTVTTASCGHLTCEQAKEGSTATIIYAPDERFREYSRLWYHQARGQINYHQVYDSKNISLATNKYKEVPFENQYRLKILNATIDDSGLYSITCNRNPYMFSTTCLLQVTSAESATLHNTERSFSDLGKSVPVVRYDTSKNHLTTKVHSVRTDKYEDATDITVKVVHVTLCNTEKSNVKVSDDVTTGRHDTNEQLVTAILHTYSDQVSDKSMNQDPNQSFTRKATENASDNKRDGQNLNNELELLIPITVGVVGLVVAVAIGTVCLTVYKKKIKVKKQRKKLQAKSDDTQSTDIRLTMNARGSEFSPNELKEEAQISSSDAKSKELEPPEYASVIPKAKRESEAKQNISEKKQAARCDNTETENQLVYAELDLQPVSNSRPTTRRYEATEYVSVDFSKTRISQANTVLPEQQDTTEYVSVDFSKTAELQTIDQGDTK